MLGLGTSLIKGGKVGRTYVKDGLKLYMPYRGSDAAETQFVGTGSTSFDGDNDYVDCGSDATLNNIFDGGGTVAVWIKPNSDGEGNEGRIVEKRDDGTGWVFHVITESAGSCKLKVFRNFDSTSGQYISGADVTIGAWNHVAVTYDSSGAGASYVPTIYVNGVVSTLSSTTNSVGSAVTDASESLVIGNTKTNTDRTFDGSIKNCAIWNRALTATEVQNVMYKTYPEVSGRLASGLVSWWALDVDYTDYHGDNDGTNSGSTLDTDLYGGDTPVIPRGIDNAPTVQADAIGAGSALFDGVDDYVDITGVISSLSSATTGTIMAWVKPVSGTTEEYILNFGDANANELIGFKVMGDGDLLVQENIGGTGQWQVRTDSAAFSSGVWTHIVLTQDGTEPVLYIDGIAVAQTVTETTDKTVWFDDTSGLDDGRIGAKLSNSGYDWFTGNICQVGIWQGALTQAVIQSVMEKTYEELTASEKTNLVSYWALDVDGSDSHGDNDGTLT